MKPGYWVPAQRCGLLHTKPYSKESDGLCPESRAEPSLWASSAAAGMEARHQTALTLKCWPPCLPGFPCGSLGKTSFEEMGLPSAELRSPPLGVSRGCVCRGVKAPQGAIDTRLDCPRRKGVYAVTSTLSFAPEPWLSICAQVRPRTLWLMWHHPPLLLQAIHFKRSAKLTSLPIR